MNVSIPFHKELLNNRLSYKFFYGTSVRQHVMPLFYVQRAL